MTNKRRAKDRRRRRRRKTRSTSYKGSRNDHEIATKALTEGTDSVSNDDMSDRFEIGCEVAKVDDDLGVVFGWALVSKEDTDIGIHIDLQTDHVPEQAMLKAATGFAGSARMAKEMHVGGGRGTVLFLLPLTSEVAKSLGIVTKQTGLIIGMKPDAEMLAKFKSGELTGFSIGGRRIVDTPREITVE